MMRYIFLLTALVSVLTAPAAGAKTRTAAPQPSQPSVSEVPSETDTPVVDGISGEDDYDDYAIDKETLPIGKPLESNPATNEYVSRQDFDSLKAKVDALTSQKNNDTGEESSGTGLGMILMSIVVGALAGGVAAYVLVKKICQSSKMPEGRDESTACGKKPHSAILPLTPQDNTHSSNASANPINYRTQPPRTQPDTPSQLEQQREDQLRIQREREQRAREQEAERQQAEERARQSMAASIRTAYGDLMIMGKDSMVISDSDFADRSQGKKLMFKIDRAKGYATFTFTQDTLANAINNLSGIEPYVEPFEYNPSLNRVNVDSPGTLHFNSGGYWEVDKRITISLS